MDSDSENRKNDAFKKGRRKEDKKGMMQRLD